VLDGSCQTPIAGLAEITGDRIALRGEVLRPDGTGRIAGEIAGPRAEAADLGRELARRMLAEAPDDFFFWRD
jgi:hydroxymethylbilane synthase